MSRLFTYRTFSFLLFLALTIAIAPMNASAHRVTIFAWEDSGRIFCESTFSGGKKAMDSAIRVEDAATGALLLTGKTDANGLFDFPIPAEAAQKRMDLRLVLNAGTGHAGEWIIAANEYLGGDENWQEVAPAVPITDAATAPAPLPHGCNALDAATLKRIVERAVDKKIAPIARKLAEQQTAGPSVSDIFGGIGYIFGLFGVAALVQSRRRK